ncbi:MFS transporter [Klebsiella pneumoniae]|uniref:MFS transporter n=1 Tax=Klebsiella pneumoniae TaxID=573 RepID=UPI0013D56999|nr:MFS transporter [Klebsiella pneumoniae]
MGSGHATPTQFQWIVADAVAFGLLLVPSGRLGDVIGRRSVFLFGSLLFMLE